MNDPLRLVVLGYGFIGDLHTRAAQACGAIVVEVSGHDGARAAAFADLHGIERSGSDWEQAVAADDVDAVVVGTPNALHHPQTMAALAAGKHVLVDKPMAMTVVEGTQMRDAAEASGLTLLVGHMWRYRDEVVALRDRIARGDLGRVVRTRGYGIHAGWGPSGWFVDPALSGGGALIDMGVHAIDTARFLLGDPRARRVTASIGHAYGERGGYGERIDDDGVVLIDWEPTERTTGVRSVIECGWWQPALDGVEAETDVYATGGHARIWPAFRTAGPPAGYEHCDLPMYRAQMADFLHCCRSGATPRASADVGLEVLRIVEAAYASSDEVNGPEAVDR